MTSGEEAMPWNGQSLARPDDELFERRLPQELAGRLAKRHQHAAVAAAASGSRIASLLVPTSTTPPPTVGIAVGLRAELGHPLHVLAGLDVPRRRHALHRRHHVAGRRAAPHRPVGGGRRRGTTDGQNDRRIAQNRSTFAMLLVLVDLHVVEIDVRDAVGVDAGAAHVVRNLVDLLDRPRRRLGSPAGHTLPRTRAVPSGW